MDTSSMWPANGAQTNSPHCTPISAAATGQAASSSGSRRRRTNVSRSSAVCRASSTSSNTSGMDQSTRCANTCMPSSGVSHCT